MSALAWLALACFLVVATSAGQAAPITLGPGDVASTANDGSGDLIAVDLVNAMPLVPGVYSATSFNRQYTSVNGAIQPLVLVGGSSVFRTRAAGDTQAVAATSPFAATNFGGSSTFSVGTGETVYAGVYWDQSAPGAMPVGFASSGSSFVRYAGAAAPVVGSLISGGGGAGTFARAYDFSIDVVQQQTGQVGNTVSARTLATDSSATVFWSSHHAVPYAGELHVVDVHDQGQSGSFELFQLRATNTTGNSFQIVNRSGAIAVSTTASGSTKSYVLPTSFDVLPGDLVFHRGNGIPWTQDASTAAAHNNHTIYNNGTAPGINANLTLGAGGFPAYAASAQKRDYAWAVQAPGVVERVGNGTTNGSNIDTGVGILAVLSGDGFSKLGRVDQWHLFSNGAGATASSAGRSVTPLIFQQSGTGFEITGIGMARVSDNSGLQMFDFDLVSGSDVVGPGFFVGWWDGSGSTSNAGVIEWADTDGSFPINLWLDSNGVAVGDIYDDGTNGMTYSYSNLARQYSLNFTTVMVPEPQTGLVAACGILAMFLCLRRRATK